MTEQVVVDPDRRDGRRRRGRLRGGPDRMTVALFALSAFLLVLALLGTQLSHTVSTRAEKPTAVLIRRIYRTTVIERVLPAGSGGSGSASVTQSVSGSASSALAPAALPVTRTS